MRELVSNDYCRVLFDPTTSIARFIRSSVAIRSLDEASRFFGEAISAIDGLGRQRIKLIIDSREAPLRNDPQYETAMADYRRRIAHNIRKIAVITKTAAGRLHAQRLGKLDQLEQVIVATEEEALQYLMRRD